MRKLFLKSDSSSFLILYSVTNTFQESALPFHNLPFQFDNTLRVQTFFNFVTFCHFGKMLPSINDMKYISI